MKEKQLTRLMYTLCVIRTASPQVRGCDLETAVSYDVVPGNTFCGSTHLLDLSVYKWKVWAFLK